VRKNKSKQAETSRDKTRQANSALGSGHFSVVPSPSCAGHMHPTCSVFRVADVDRTPDNACLFFCRGVAAAASESTASQWQRQPGLGPEEVSGFGCWPGWMLTKGLFWLGELGGGTSIHRHSPGLFVRGGTFLSFCGLCGSFWALWHAPLVARVSWQLGIV